MFFLDLLQNIHVGCGYKLEPPRLLEPSLTNTHDLCFGAKIRQLGTCIPLLTPAFAI